MIMAWFNLNKIDVFARTLTYSQIPKYYTYDKQKRMFKPRKRGFAIGRINYVPRHIEEGYFLRILLNIVKGPKCFDDIKTWNEIVYERFKDECEACGILEDEQAYIDSIISASEWCFAYQIRRLFAITLLSDFPSKPELIWEATWELLTDNIENKIRQKLNNPG